MGTAKNLKLRLLFGVAALAVGASAEAAPVPLDSNVPRMEATAACADGSCFRHDGGLDGVKGQLHTINIFNKNGVDPRVPESTLGAGNPLSFVAKLKTNQPVPVKRRVKDPKTGVTVVAETMINATSTAFFVSPCLAITTFHSVFGDTKAPDAASAGVTITAGGLTGTAHAIAYGPFHTDGSSRYDKALVKMDNDNCIGAKVGWAEPSDIALSAWKDLDLITAGYPVSKFDPTKPNRLWRDTTIRLQALERQSSGEVLLVSGAISKGNSGGPVGYIENGKFRIVGMIVAERAPTEVIQKEWSQQTTNSAIRLSDIYSLGVGTLVREDKARFAGLKNPNS